MNPFSFLRRPTETPDTEAVQQRRGAPMPDAMEEQIGAEMLTRGNVAVIGEEDIKRGLEILQKYKQGRAAFEERIVQDELWYQGRHWEVMRKEKKRVAPEPSSAWLFNTIMNKHADAMDNYPKASALPREQSDEQSAKTISEILPVIMEQNEFEQTFSDNWWEKLKHGTAVYGVFWNPALENGLGDIDIKAIDLLKIFWEPGITDIQKSRNLFIVDLVDADLLAEEYPQYADKFSKADSNGIVREYIHDKTIDTTNKALVVDWYYKRRNPNGVTSLHYIKFCGDALLYASENDPVYRDRGFYDHGMYPVVFDNLYPEKGTPAGFGLVAITKDPQMYIDKLSANILETSMMGTKVRYFALGNTGINEEEFLDWNKPIVHVEGNSLEDTRLRRIDVGGIDGIYFNVMQQKTEEMKETSGNRDVNSGGGSGVTAAAAISALQEAGNKSSRDMIKAAYRAYRSLAKLCVELMRQFYDVKRSFRITMDNNAYQFIDFDNRAIKDQITISEGGEELLYRRPVFDIVITAEKSNPFSQMSQNETAKELYQRGFFAPEKAQESLIALNMMDFEGIEKVKEQVMRGQTLLNLCQQQQMEIIQLRAMMGAIPTQMPNNAPQSENKGAEGNSSSPTPKTDGSGLARSAKEAQTPMTPYGQALAKRSTPSVEG